MRHESGIMWTAIVMAVMMIMGSAGLYLTQHISILFVGLSFTSHYTSQLAAAFPVYKIYVTGICSDFLDDWFVT